MKSLYIYFSINAVYLYAQFFSNNGDFKVFTNDVFLYPLLLFLLIFLQKNVIHNT